MEEDNILYLSKKLNEKIHDTKNLIESFKYPDPKVDAFGNVGPANYPPEIQDFRLKFLNKVIKISDNLKLYYVEMVEEFFRIIIREQWLQKGEPINVVQLWESIIKKTIPPDLIIDFESMLPEQKSLGTPIPQCAAIGKVIKKEILNHDDCVC